MTFTVTGTGYSNITLGNDTQLVGYDIVTGHPKIIDANEPPGKTEPPYGSDHIGHGYFDNIPNVHDVTVSKIVAPAFAISGNPVPINVTVRSEGNFTDSFDVTVYVNNTFVGAQPANLTRGAKATLTFSWNTTDVVAGNYAINATALPAEDIDLSDNAKIKQVEIKSHNVAVISLEVPAKAIIGDIVPINATVRNEGQLVENVTLTIYSEEYGIGSPSVINETNFILAEHLASRIILISWNTTRLASGDYRINATATIDIDDVPEDNIKTKLTKLDPPTHDMVVVSISANPLTVFAGQLVTINVTIRNDGTFNETDVQVNIAYDSTAILGQAVSLIVGENKSLSFTWNTTGVSPNAYSVKAEAILDGDATPTNNAKYAAVDVVAPPPGHIAGTVKDATTGDPVVGANVTANGHFDLTDANGQFNITNVPIGTYDVTASAAGYEASSQVHITVAMGQTTNIDFTLTPTPTTGHITGIVTDASTGNPVVGANVTANGHSVLTGADGSYTLELQHGTYTITASADGYEESSRTGIIVEAGESTTVSFELTPTQQPVQPLDTSLYIALAVVAIIVIAGIAIYFLKFKK